MRQVNSRQDSPIDPEKCQHSSRPFFNQPQKRVSSSCSWLLGIIQCVHMSLASGPFEERIGTSFLSSHVPLGPVACGPVQSDQKAPVVSQSFGTAGCFRVLDVFGSGVRLLRDPYELYTTPIRSGHHLGVRLMEVLDDRRFLLPKHQGSTWGGSIQDARLFGLPMRAFSFTGLQGMGDRNIRRVVAGSGARSGEVGCQEWSEAQCSWGGGSSSVPSWMNDTSHETHHVIICFTHLLDNRGGEMMIQPFGATQRNPNMPQAWHVCRITKFAGRWDAKFVPVTKGKTSMLAQRLPKRMCFVCT